MVYIFIFFNFIALFFGSRQARISEPILTIYTSYDVLLPKNVPFGGVTIAGVDLPVAEQMKVLGVVLDQRLTFEKHDTAVAKSCNYHAQAIRHIRHLLTLDLAQTLACIV